MKYILDTKRLSKAALENFERSLKTFERAPTGYDDWLQELKPASDAYVSTLTTRPVTVYDWYKPEGSDYKTPPQKKVVSAANFHCFGTDYQPLENSLGTYSTAIVEMPDGEVRNVPVDLIRFDD